LGFIVLVDCKVNSLRLFVLIDSKNNTTIFTIYKVRSTPEIIIGRSCTLKTYSDKSIGTINLELLNAIVYHEDIATSRAHITPRQIVSFVLFFIMVSSDEMYLSLVEINISLQRLAVNRKDTNTSLSQKCLERQKLI
jgi:hypothetical protein